LGDGYLIFTTKKVRPESENTVSVSHAGKVSSTSSSIMNTYVFYKSEHKVLICKAHQCTIPWKSITSHFRNEHEISLETRHNFKLCIFHRYPKRRAMVLLNKQNNPFRISRSSKDIVVTIKHATLFWERWNQLKSTAKVITNGR
jgi:hypothetical protein